MTTLEKEIREQSALLANLGERQGENIARIVSEIKKRDIGFVYFAGRGTSDHACIYAQYLYQIDIGVPCALAAPSVVSQYGGKPMLKNALTIGVSQSGKAQDVLGVIELARSQGGMTVAVTNDEASPLALAADFHLFCDCGEEVSIAATKTFTSQMLLLALLGAKWAGDGELEKAFKSVGGEVKQLLDTVQPGLDAICMRRRDIKSAVVLGRGLAYPIALEGALKILETNRIKMRGYSSSDFYHGPQAQIYRDDAAFVIALRGKMFADACSMIARLHDIGADVVVYTDDAELASRENSVLLPRSDFRLPDAVGAFNAAVALQMTAKTFCEIRGFDPNQSELLRKVTVTY